MQAYALGVGRRQSRSAQPDPRLLDVDYGIGTTEYMRRTGGYGVTLECGQHQDPNAPEVAARAIRQTLALTGLIDAPLEAARQDFQVLQLLDVIDREDTADRFVRPWASFDAVRAGEVIGHRASGAAVTVGADGFIVFPNPNALPGAEWFYFAEASTRRLT